MYMNLQEMVGGSCHRDPIKVVTSTRSSVIVEVYVSMVDGHEL